MLINIHESRYSNQILFRVSCLVSDAAPHNAANGGDSFLGKKATTRFPVSATASFFRALAFNRLAFFTLRDFGFEETLSVDDDFLGRPTGMIGLGS